MVLWFTTVRKAALIACIAAVLDLLIPGSTAIRSMLATASTQSSSTWWALPVSSFTVLFSAIQAVFLFALYRNEEPLRLTERMRLLSLAAAAILGVIVALELPRWIVSLGPYLTAMKRVDWTSGATSLGMAVRDPGTVRVAAALLSLFSNLAVFLLLIALFREAGHTPIADAPVSPLLGVMAKMAVIVWGLWLAFNLLRLVLTPYSHSQLRDYAIQTGQSPPALGDMMAEAIRTLLITACVFTVPYVIYKRRPVT